MAAVTVEYFSAPVGMRARERQVPSPRVSVATYHRRRLVVATSIAAVLLVVGVALGRLGAGPLASPLASRAGLDLVAEQTYVVAQGDTDWSIARQIQPQGDLRPLVGYLAAQHAGRPLQIGETLQLP